jgi:hypothetical protein
MAVAAALFFAPQYNFAGDLPALRTVAATLRVRAPMGGSMLVVNRGLWLYTMAGMTPPTIYFNSMHLLCAFPNAEGSPLDEAMATRPRFLVVADESFGAICEQNERWKVVHDAIASNYHKLTHASSPRDFFDVYEINAGKAP